jgi:hypothetical protein
MESRDITLLFFCVTREVTLANNTLDKKFCLNYWSHAFSTGLFFV